MDFKDAIPIPVKKKYNIGRVQSGQYTPRTNNSTLPTGEKALFAQWLKWSIANKDAHNKDKTRQAALPKKALTRKGGKAAC